MSNNNETCVNDKAQCWDNMSGTDVWECWTCFIIANRFCASDRGNTCGESNICLSTPPTQDLIEDISQTIDQIVQNSVLQGLGRYQNGFIKLKEQVQGLGNALLNEQQKRQLVFLRSNLRNFNESLDNITCMSQGEQISLIEDELSLVASVMKRLL